MTDHATRAREIVQDHHTCDDACTCGKDDLARAITQALTRAAEEAATELGDLRLRLNCPMVAPSCLVCGQQKELVIKHLEASAIGVCEVCRTAAQAAQPVWSKDKPTVAGWYWWRPCPGEAHGEQVVNVFAGEYSAVRFLNGNDAKAEFLGGEWAPIPLPREA